MSRIGRTLLFFVAISLLAFALAPLTSHPAAASGTQAVGFSPTLVKVVNTPLPVQGSVSVANTPLAITNSLNAANNPAALLVSSTVAQPYQDTCTGGGKGCNFQTIPSGVHLVIQEVDFQGDLATGTSDIVITTTVNGVAISHFIPVTNGANYVVSHQQTTMYADPNTTPQCGPNQVFAGTSTCALSGYLAPVQ